MQVCVLAVPVFLAFLPGSLIILQQLACVARAVPPGNTIGLCTNSSVSIGSVTIAICTNTPDICETYMKKGNGITTCRQYCNANGMQCSAMYDDDNSCRRKQKYSSCDETGGGTTDHICQCIVIEFSAFYGGNDFCTETSPCSVGQGDCDNDKECASGYTCWQRCYNGPAAPDVSFTSNQIKGRGDYCYNPGKQHIILANSSCSHVFAAVSVSG